MHILAEVAQDRINKYILIKWLNNRLGEGLFTAARWYIPCILVERGLLPAKRLTNL
jgi:hypothetical protein